MLSPHSHPSQDQKTETRRQPGHSLYKELSTQRPTFVRKLQRRFILLAFNGFYRMGDARWTDKVLDDVLHKWDKSVTAKVGVLSEIIQAYSFKFFQGTTILKMLDFFLETEEARNALDHLLVKLSRRILEELPPSGADFPILKILEPLLMTRLSQKTPLGGLHSLTFNPSPALVPAFLLVHRYVGLRNERRALDILDRLVTERFIPTDAVVMLPTPSIHLTVTMALVKAALHWQHNTLGLSILLDTLEHYRHARFDDAFHIFIDETVTTSLETPSSSDLQVLARLFVAMHRFRPASSSMIRSYYAKANELDYARGVSYFYAFASENSSHHTYPEPEGPALLWLMKDYSAPNGKFFLARRLAGMAATGRTILPLHIRAEFISIVARSGFAVSARKLWYLYACGKHKEELTGNATLMIRLVSLFTHLADREVALLKRSRRIKGPDTEPGSTAQSTHQENVATDGQPEAFIGGDKSIEVTSTSTVNDAMLEMGSQQSTIQETVSEDEQLENDIEAFDVEDKIEPGDFAETIVETEDDIETSGMSKDDEDSSPPNAAPVNKAEEYQDFARLVLEEYKVVHWPLENAPHVALTSLARAYFIMGDFEEGFKMYDLLFKNKMLPDIVDINVALGVVAERSPRIAWGMVERMAKRGMHPDSITLGTILHNALEHRAESVALQVLQMAVDLPSTDSLTNKSINTFLRSVVSKDALDRITPEQGLKRIRTCVYLIRDGLVNKKDVATIPMGKYLVNAALYVKDPMSAYELWRFTLKHRENWDDSEQNRLRQLTYNMLLTQNKGAEMSKETLSALRELRSWGKGNSENSE